MEVLFVGIDPSLTSTGLCIKKSKARSVIDTYFYNITTKPNEFKNRFERYNYITNTIKNMITRHTTTIALVGIEGYSLYSQGNALSSMIENGYSIRKMLIETNIPFIELAPLTVKAFVTKVQGADKTRVRQEAIKMMTQQEKNALKKVPEKTQYDMVDSWIMASLAEKVFREDGDLKWNKKMNDKIIWNKKEASFL